MSKVLVVDDNRDLAYKQSCFLGAMGYDSRYATSGEEGLRLAEEHRPDVVLIDVSMPDMSGVELAGRIRNLFPSIHLLSWSGWPISAHEAVQGGFAHSFTKPLDVDILLHALEELPRRCHA